MNGRQEQAVRRAGGAATAVSEETLDPAALANIRSLQDVGGANILRELVDLFFADAEPRRASLRSAAARGDAETMEKTAHALKGSCANFGARRLAAVCQEIQALARSRDLRGADRLLVRLDEEYGQVRAALIAEVAKG